jgi:ATP-dependent protease Clp ATPase subunit
VVRQSLQRQTGARGLASVLTRILEDVAFERFASEQRGAVVLRLEGERVVVND